MSSAFKKRLEESGFKLDERVIRHEPLGFHDYNNLQMNAFAVVSDSGTLPEESSFLLQSERAFLRFASEPPQNVPRLSIRGASCLPELMKIIAASG